MKSSFITFLLIFFCAKGDAAIGKEESRQYEGSKDSDNSCYGDVESLSSDSFEQTSDSEGDRSEMFSKGNVCNLLKFSNMMTMIKIIQLKSLSPNRENC